MSRLALLACLPLLLLFAACGGDGDDEDEGSSEDGGAQAVPDDATPTPTPKLLPTPPAATDDEVILTAGTEASPFTPTLAEFRQLPTTKIEADGEKEGVSLAEIARHTEAPDDTTVTIQGYRRDGRRIQFIREPLSEIGEQSVLVVGEDGRLSFYSSALGEDQWLTNVLVVSFP
jgi:hypothetical protein